MELLKIKLEHFNIIISCSPYLWGVLFLIFLMILGCKFLNKPKMLKGDIDVNEVELGIGNNKIKIKRNYQTVQIAYKLWVELNTRKLGIKIDEENDVISEIYDS